MHTHKREFMPSKYRSVWQKGLQLFSLREQDKEAAKYFWQHCVTVRKIITECVASYTVVRQLDILRTPRL
jgi:hypothetical protein